MGLIAWNFRSALTPLLVLLTLFSAHAQQPGPEVPQDRVGVFRGRLVHYTIIDGRPIMGGDVILDHVGDVSSLAHDQSFTLNPNGSGIDDKTYLWPKVDGVFTVPYIIVGADRDAANSAITIFNTTFKGFFQFKSRKQEADYVAFDVITATSTCESEVGRVGGKQKILGAGCDAYSLLHEMGHAIGLLHEHERADRDAYVQVNLYNVIDHYETQLEAAAKGVPDIGPYDYASIMHYSAFAFRRFGTYTPTIETIPAGIDIGGDRNSYSAGDIDTVYRLYGSAPRKVTVTTNPSGLPVLIDGVQYTAPATFNWAIGSTHTLAVSTNGQLEDIGGTYVYGRWSDNGAIRHKITVLPGDGSSIYPRTAPATTVYIANFIQLMNPRFSKDSEGNKVDVSPKPQSYPGVKGLYYAQRQPVTYTAKPAPGSIFMRWVFGGSNPLKITIGQPTDAIFGPSNEALTEVTTEPAGVDLHIDNFATIAPAYYDWAKGTQHTITPSTSAHSLDTQLTLIGVKGGSPNSDIFVATGAHRQSIVFNYSEKFGSYLRTIPDCAAGISISPSSSDGFYTPGTVVKISADAMPGWQFTGWTDDFAGRKLPTAVTMNREFRANALYNITAAPLAVSSLQPTMVKAGKSATTMSIIGSGFAASSAVSIDGKVRKATFVNSSQLSVKLTAADLALPRTFPVSVTNTAGNCSNQVLAVFTVYPG